MKNLLSIISLFLLLSTGSAFAQYSYQDINSQLVTKKIKGIASDDSGNVIVTGNFTTTITFGSTTLVNNQAAGGGEGAAFIAKQDPNGNFTWAKCINLQTSGGGTNGYSQVYIAKVATDAAGNIYLSGGYAGTIKLDNLNLSSAKSTWDLFTVKMSPNGAFLWAKSEGTGDDIFGCSSESGNAVFADALGNVFSTGFVVGKVFKNTFACGCGNSKPVLAMYLVKYNAAGTKLWEKKYMNSLETATSPCNYYSQGFDVKSDGSNVYLLGKMYGSVNFGVATLSTGSNTVANTVLLKLDTNGNPLWVRSATNADNNAFDIMLDNNNNDIYLSGSFFNGTLSFGGPTLTTSTRTQFIAKYSAAGTCSWAMMPGNYGVINFSGHHMFKHPNGNIGVLTSGWSNLPAPFALKEFSTSNGSIVDSTVASIMTSAVDVVSLPGGFVYAQNLKGSYDFGGITISSTQPTTSTYSDMILVKYGSAPPMVHPTGVESISSAAAVTLYPNPATNHITIANSPDKMLGTVSIFDISGKIIFQQTFTTSEAKIDVSDFAPGLYFVKSDELQEQLKFVRE